MDKCIACGTVGRFTDQPDGYVSGRWKGKEDFKACRCDNCGATYPIESIDKDVRKEN